MPYNIYAFSIDCREIKFVTVADRMIDAMNAINIAEQTEIPMFAVRSDKECAPPVFETENCEEARQKYKRIHDALLPTEAQRRGLQLVGG